MTLPRNPYESPAPLLDAAPVAVPWHSRADVYLSLLWCTLGIAWIWCGGHAASGRLYSQTSYGLFGYLEFESRAGVIKSAFYPELFGLSLALSLTLIILGAWQVRSLFRQTVTSAT